MTRNDSLDLAALNPEQFAAVTHGAGPLLIVAGPGSGKTRVITHRIAWLVREQGVDPRRILAATFTNRAAREMRDRVGQLIGGTAARLVWLGTFHGHCVRMLRELGPVVGVPNGFVIYDVDDQRRVIRRAIQNLRLDSRLYLVNSVRSVISENKRNGVTPAEFAEAAENDWEPSAARIWEMYQRELHAAAALDFDDIIDRGGTLIRARNGSRYRERFVHTFVDEFQDTDKAQYGLMRGWSHEHGNVVVVGDPDQAIYSWRGAAPKNIARFRADHPGLSVIELNTNYRSTQQILDIANGVMSPAHEREPRTLVAVKPDGEKPVFHEALHEGDEATFIVSKIQTQRREALFAPSDVAVLYRTHAQSRAIEDALVHEQIPYRIIGGTPFYEREEVRDLVSYLRLVHNPTDDLAFRRVVNTPPRGVGTKSLRTLTDWGALHDRTLIAVAAAACGRERSSVAPPQVSRRAANGLRRFLTVIDQAREIQTRQPLDATLRYIIDEIKVFEHLQRRFREDAETRWENIQELITVAAGYSEMDAGAALGAFLTDVALYAGVDNLPDGERNFVTLTTMHQAKGLEFPAVFVAGCEDGLIPHSRSMEDLERFEEERRLLYVAVTRAEQALFLLHTEARTLFGRMQVSVPSCLLDGVQDDLLTMTRAAPDRSAKRREFGLISSPTADSADGPLKPGELVAHRVFGDGLVLAVKQLHDDVEVAVRFEREGIRYLRSSLAPLVRR